MHGDLARTHELDLASEADVLGELLLGERVVFKGCDGGEEVMAGGDGDHAGGAVTGVTSKGDGSVGRRGVVEQIDQGDGGVEGVGTFEDGEGGHVCFSDVGRVMGARAADISCTAL